jgi:hypothetical protein
MRLGVLLLAGWLAGPAPAQTPAQAPVPTPAAAQPYDPDAVLVEELVVVGRSGWRGTARSSSNA